MNFMDLHGFSWIFMGFHGFSLISWIIMDFHGFHGFPWIIIDLHGLPCQVQARAGWGRLGLPGAG